MSSLSNKIFQENLNTESFMQDLLNFKPVTVCGPTPPRPKHRTGKSHIHTSPDRLYVFQFTVCVLSVNLVGFSILREDDEWLFRSFWLGQLIAVIGFRNQKLRACAGACVCLAQLQFGVLCNGIFQKVLEFLKLLLKDRMKAGKLDIITDCGTLVCTVSSETVWLGFLMLLFKLTLSILACYSLQNLPHISFV